MKLTYKKEPVTSSVYSLADTTTVEVTVHCETLDIALEEFGNFLRGCGFVFSGHVEIVEED